MKLFVEEGAEYREIEVIIRCQKTDSQVMKLISALRIFERKITGYRDGQTFLLEAEKLLYIETVDKKTFLYTSEGVYETSLRLYELEDRLAACDFFRASKSMVINFNEIKSMRPDFGGRMQLAMSNGETVFVSRQYAWYIKEKLGLK